LKIWKPEYPNLTILCGRNYLANNNIEKVEQENITYIEKYIQQEEYLKLINKIGIHLCLSKLTNFSNTMHDAISTNNIVIGLDCVPYKSYISNNYNGFLVKANKRKLKNTLGSEYIIDEEDLVKTIEKINKYIDENNIEKDEDDLREMANKVKREMIQNDRIFDQKLKGFFDIIRKKYMENIKLKSHYECFDEDLPSVSIITPTYNRFYLFHLAIRNFLKTDYPKDKIEWIIIDDSTQNRDDMEKLIQDNNDGNIKHIKLYDLKKKKTIGDKRNMGVEHCSNDIIVCMDDDDYYPPESVKTRIANLEHLNCNVVGASNLGILEINKIISTITIASYSLPYNERIYESTLAFRKTWWENNKFDSSSKNEGKGFLKNSIEEMEEIPWNGVIVSLKHYKNTNYRVNVKGETNGSHFKFSDDLFEMLTKIDNE